MDGRPIVEAIMRGAIQQCVEVFLALRDVKRPTAPARCEQFDGDDGLTDEEREAFEDYEDLRYEIEREVTKHAVQAVQVLNGDIPDADGLTHMPGMGIAFGPLDPS